MTRKKTVADAMLRIPAAMAEVALDELPTAARERITPTQSAALLQICVSAARGIAFVLDNPQARVLPTADGTSARVENPPERADG